MGGMGEVYRAHDARLNRDVAIKVLSTATSPDGNVRLLREARSAAGLNHPHVCTIYEVGETDGHAYIAMELVEGKPLDQLIHAGGLPFEDIVRYSIQIADAIAHAHARGIVHRDLKPANVMIADGGEAKVLDFGLAKVLSVDDQSRLEFTISHTAAGLVVGTAAYMSPEQVLGRTTDERTDIFSFGALLYEMATGTRVFSGATPIEVLASVLHEQPKPVASVRGGLPAGLSRVVDKALAKDPSQRYQRMSELRDDLNRLQTSDRAAVIRVRRRLPSRALAATAAFGAIAVVIAVVWKDVRARHETDPNAIAARPLVQDPTGSSASPFASLRKPRGPLQGNSLAAYRAVTEAAGLYTANRWEAALEASKRAADLDPEYAEAWAMLGKVYARLASPPGLPAGASIEDIRTNALTSARRAMELDPSSYEANVALAVARRDLRQIDLSRAAARKAIQLGPQFAEAYAALAETYSETSGWGCGHDRDDAVAIALFRRAYSIDHKPGALINALKYDKQFEEALRFADEGLRREPTARGVRRQRAWILLEVGRLHEAEQMLREAAADGGIRGNDLMYLAGIELKRGHLEAAAEGFKKAGATGIEVARQYIEAKLPRPALPHLEAGLRKEPACADFLLHAKGAYWSVIRSDPAARELLEKYRTR